MVQRTICQWASHSHIGLHASYKAHAQYAQVMQEKQNLLRATLLPITQNRMHYLMLHLPATCRLLL
ncbi:MAG TPA: hypothetical protein PKD90_19775, partial [Phnomibacter sp.]|nr:hypothetical protein [Phnomibacter sp.]